MKSILTFLSAATLALAAPQVSSSTRSTIAPSPSPTSISKAAVWVQLCRDTNFSPSQCTIEYPEDNKCVNAPAGWNDVVSSVRLGLTSYTSGSKDQPYCRFYLDNDCPAVEDSGTGWRHFDLAGGDGIADLSRFGDGAANDQISSYRCQKL